MNAAKSRTRLDSNTAWGIGPTREPFASKSLQDKKDSTIQIDNFILKTESRAFVTGLLQQGFYATKKNKERYRLHHVIRLAWQLLNIQTRAISSEIRHEHKLQPGSVRDRRIKDLTRQNILLAHAGCAGYHGHSVG
jgi:hypothetical protein